MTETAGVVVAAQLVTAAGLYVWTSLALAAVFAKAGREPWRAWVPVLNLWTLFELAGMRGWWAGVVAGAVVVAGVVAGVLGSSLGAAALQASFGGDAAAAQSLAITAVAAPAAVMLVVLVPVLVLQVRMLVGVGRGFGLRGGIAVLGALLFPAWASVVGWGSARWLGPTALHAGLRSSSSGAAPSAPRRASAPVVPALADFSGRPAAAPAFSDVPVFDTPAAPVTAPADHAHEAWAPPSVRPGSPFGSSAPQGAAARQAFPAPRAASAAFTVRAGAPDARSDDDGAGTPAPAGEPDDATMLVARRHGTWYLALPDRTVVELTGDAAVLGRNPIAPAHAPRAQVVAVVDITRTVSKTHALLTRTATGWTVTDLDSTNGVFVGDTADTAAEVDGTAPIGDAFFLGDARLVIRAGT